MEKHHLVSLCPLQESHLALTRTWINDPRVALPFQFNRTVSEEEHRQWFDALQKDETQSIFALLNSDHAHVGNLGFKGLEQEVPEMWLYIGPEYQGKGLGKLAASGGIEMGFNGFCREEIKLRLLKDNGAAKSIYRSAGFVACAADLVSAYFENLEQHFDCMVANRKDIDGHFPRVAMMQPMMIPWLGFFELLHTADIFIFLDDFQFSRQGWGHRNRLFSSPGQVGYVTLPISHPKNIAATFSDFEIRNDTRWQKKLTKSLSQTYGRSEYFQETMTCFERMFQDIETGKMSMAEIEIAMIMRMGDALDIDTQICLSSQFDTANLKRSERVLALLEATEARVYYAARGSLDYMEKDGVFPNESIRVYFQNFNPRPYPQPGSKDFQPRLSAIDAFLNIGPTATKGHLKGTRRWLPWDEAVNSDRAN